MAHATCAVDDCDTEARARGWCDKHYKRWRRFGDPLDSAPPSPPKPFAQCSMQGCSEKHFAKGMCKIHYSRDWYATNVHRAKANQAEYRAANRDANRERVRRWREANPDRARAACRAYSQAHCDRIREAKRRYRAANRDAIRALNNRRKALQRGAPVNDLTARQWKDIKAAYRHRCAYCGQRRFLTMDHVIPLSRGGGHTASNIVPACQSCNSRKNDGPAPQHQPLLF